MEKIRRSLLFVPGSTPQRFEKAVAAGADMVCIDLEDAVAPQDKKQARQSLIDFYQSSGSPACELGLRINAISSAVGLMDILALIDSALDPDFIMLPKVAHEHEIFWLGQLLTATDCHLIPVIESAQGLQWVNEIFACDRVQCAVFGAVDFSADVGCGMHWEALLYARSQLAAAAAQNHVTLFDVPAIDIDDLDSLTSSTRRAKALGLNARAAIHPKQIIPIHRALAPDQSEVEYAQRIMAAFKQADGNAVLLDGRLVELPVVKSARRILEIANMKD